MTCAMEPREKKKRLSSSFKFSEFYFGSSICTLEELKDFLEHLKRIPRKSNHAFKSRGLAKLAARQLTVQCGLHAWGPSAEFIMMLSERWNLQEETKYTALEIFSLFMTTLVSQLHDMICSNTDNDIENSNGELDGRKGSAHAINSTDRSNHMDWTTDDDKVSKNEMADREWRKTLEHITSQMKLRAVSSVVIATKVTDHERIVTLNKALMFLVEQGHHYSKGVLLKSELRVLSSINYNTRRFSSPHCCIMLLLEILCHADIAAADEVYPICVRLLDLFYYFRPYIIGNLCDMNVSDSGLPEISNEYEGRKILDLSSDVVRMSAALICAAVYIRHKQMSDDVIIFLSDLIGTDENSVTRDCCVMLKTLLQTEC